MNERNGSTDTEPQSNISPPVGRVGRWAKSSEGAFDTDLFSRARIRRTTDGGAPNKDRIRMKLASCIVLSPRGSGQARLPLEPFAVAEDEDELAPKYRAIP